MLPAVLSKATGRVLALATGLAGCQPDARLLGERIYEGEDFDVYASEGLVACEGTFPQMEGWLAAFRAEVGETARGARLEFFWLDEEEFGASPCDEHADGCADLDTDRVYATLIPLPHEIVHVELAHARPPDLFREGAAEMFGSARPGEQITTADVEELFVNDFGVREYAEAGKFNRFLYEALGRDDYFELYRSLPRDAGREEVDDAIQSVLSLELDDLLAEYRAFNPNCQVENWRLHPLECEAMPPTPWAEDGVWRMSLPLGCGHPTAVGPQLGRIWTRRSLDVLDEGVHEIHLTSSNPNADARLRVVACDASCMPGEWDASVNIDIESYLARPLVPGRHWVELSIADGTSTDIEVEIRPRGL